MSTHWIDTWPRTLGALEGPVLSLYVNLRPADGEDAVLAARVRAENAMRRADVPEDLRKYVLARIQQDPPNRYGRAMVLFAAEDPEEFFEVRFLQVDLPLPGRADGALARWSEPYVTPLLLVRDDYERYAVVVMDRERWRYFQVYLGEIEEVKEAFFDVDTSEWRKLTEPAQGGSPMYGTGLGKDLFEDRVEGWVRRFYKKAADLLERTMAKHRARRLILCGPEERRAEFESVLPRTLQDRVAARLPAPPKLDASPGEVLKHVANAVEEAEHAGELELVDRIREEGLGGLNQVLHELQQGRIYVLAVAWTPEILNETVYRCGWNGYVAATEAGARAFCAGQGEPEAVPLDEVLPDLVVRHGCRLEFMRDEPMARLVEELDGIGGLRRW